MDFFDEVYRSSPLWDIGRAQQEFVALDRAGEIAGDVLDVGCGTGDNALFPGTTGPSVGESTGPRERSRSPGSERIVRGHR